VDRDDGIQVVVFAGENGLRLDALHFLPEGVQFGLQFSLNRLALAGQLEVGVHIGEALSEPVVLLDLLA
jgi:hypothetical protein